jgi:hypothetical protein
MFPFVIAGVLFITLFAAGCSVGSAPKPGMSYTVMVDPNFTVYYLPDGSVNNVLLMPDILTALDSWTALIPALNLKVVIGKPTGAAQEIGLVAGTTEQQTADSIQEHEDLAGWTTPNRDNDSASIVLFGAAMRATATKYNIPWDTFAQMVVAHELGHAMGLFHTGTGTLMCANPGCAVPAPTTLDVIQFQRVRQ